MLPYRRAQDVRMPAALVAPGVAPASAVTGRQVLRLLLLLPPPLVARAREQGSGGRERWRMHGARVREGDTIVAGACGTGEAGGGGFGLLQGGHGMQQALEMARSMAGLAGAPGMPTLGLRASAPLTALHTMAPMAPSQLELLGQQQGGQSNGLAGQAGARGANKDGDKEEVFRGAKAGDDEEGERQDKDDSNEGSEEQELEGEEGEGDSDDAGMVIDDE